MSCYILVPADAPAIETPHRDDPRQLRLPLDERGTVYAKARRKRRREKRAELMAAHNRCVYCGCGVVERRAGKGTRSMSKATLDHVIPESRGGRGDSSNLVLCCFACNVVKRDRTPQEWAADILRVVETLPPKNDQHVGRFSPLRALAASVGFALPFLTKGGAS